MTHTGPRTPAGEYLRRFWQPVCYADELGDVPVGLKILGEELVAFRDFSGRIGMVEAHCPHRGTSLEYGLVSERGIRCCYHGWLFDVDGTILETPGEPAGSTFKDRLCHGAYPVREFQGIIFAYMGPPEDVPDFPILDTYEREGYRLMPGQRYDYPCNWLQILENAMDPVHASFLHTIVAGTQFTDEFGVIPNLDFLETPAGAISMGTRRVGDNVWVRTTECVLPNIQQIAPIWNDGKGPEEGLDGPMMTRWVVPRDDSSTMILELRHIAESEERNRPGGWTAARCCPPSFPSQTNTVNSSYSPATTRRRSASGPSPYTVWSTWVLPTGVSPCSVGSCAEAYAPWRRARGPANWAWTRTGTYRPSASTRRCPCRLRQPRRRMPGSSGNSACARRRNTSATRRTSHSPR